MARFKDGYSFPSDEDFRALDMLAGDIHAVAIDKGWYDEPTSFIEKLCLIHAELSEALEDYRNHLDIRAIHTTAEGKPYGVPVELADVLIRLLDLCAWLDIPIREATETKMSYNLSREYRHGGKSA